MVTWTVSQYALLGLAVGSFGLLGLRRGVNRELFSVIGVALAITLSETIASALGPQVNLFYKLGNFALGGGVTGGDPVGAWQKAQEARALIQTPDDMRLFSLAIFFLIVLVFYLLGQQRIQEAGGLVPSVLGLLAGCVNGFLMAYYFFPIVFPNPLAVIAVPSAQVQETLTSGQTIARVVLVFVFVLIALGLYSATGANERR